MIIPATCVGLGWAGVPILHFSHLSDLYRIFKTTNLNINHSLFYGSKISLMRNCSLYR